MGVKIIKAVIIALLFSLGLIIASERYQLYLSHFQSFYSISFACKDQSEFPDMLRGIRPEQTGYDIDLFYTYTVYSGDFDSSVIIYCSDDTKQKLITRYYYTEGTTNSIFFGHTILRYEDILDMPYEIFCDKRCNGHVFGKYSDLISYKQELIDQYGGSFPKVEGGDDLKESRITIIIAWLIIASIVLGFTYYTRLTGRKEFFVRYSVGDTMMRSAVMQTIIDTLMITIEFAVACLLFRTCLGRIFFFRHICIIVLVLIVINAAMHLSLPFTKFRFALSNATISEGVVNLCCVYYTVVLSLLLLLASASSISYSEYRRVRDQDWFFQKYKDYKYISLSADDYLQALEKAELFYSYNIDRYNICAASSFAEGDGFELYVLNVNMKWYLQTLLGDDIDLSQDGVFCFYPPGTDLELLEHYMNPVWAVAYGARDDDTLHYIPYTKTVKAINPSSEDYQYSINPILLYNPYHNYDQSYDERDGHALFLSRYFVKCTEEDLAQFAKEHNVQYGFYDVYNEYTYYKTMLRRIFVTSMTFSVALFVLGCILTVTLVQFEFEARKKDIAILKTMGMPLRYRYRRLFMLTGITGVLSIGIALVLSNVTGYGSKLATTLLGIIIIGFNLLFLSMTCRRNEALGVARTLKNG